MLAREGASATAPSSDGQARWESLQHDIKFVNNLLSQTGLESPFPFSPVIVESLANVARGGGSELHGLEQAVSTLITLLNSKQRENAFRTEAEDRLRKLNEELDSREALIRKFHGNLEASEKELRSTQQQLREATDRIHQLEVVASSAADESTRLRTAFAAKEKHFNTELRKRERDFEKLRDQLQNCLREPSAIIAAASRVENITQEMTGVSLQDHRDRDQHQDNDHEMDSTTVARIDLLEHENANMRQLLSSLHQILGEMRRSAHMQLHGSYAQDTPTESEPVGELHEQISSLPISWIYDKIKDEIEQSLATISDFLRATAA